MSGFAWDLRFFFSSVYSLKIGVNNQENPAQRAKYEFMLKQW